MLVAIAGALLAGMLTTLAPCALSLLPVVVGGSMQGANSGQATRRALLITAALGVSVAIFTLALRASTALIDVPVSVWRTISGVLLIGLGLVAMLPEVWDRFSTATGFSTRSGEGLARASRRDGAWGAILTGAALGPVFTSCSPLFGYLIVTILPAEPGRGLILLGAYVLGLCGVLLAVALMGQRLVRKLRWAADPHAMWRRVLGAVFVILGVLVVTGWLQQVETWVIIHSPIAPWEIGSDIGRPS